MGSRGRSRAERQGAQSGAGTGRAVLKGSGSDASRHAYPLHSTIEGAHCARSWLWTVARRSIVGRSGKIKAIEELGSGKRFVFCRVKSVAYALEQSKVSVSPNKKGQTCGDC